MILESDGTKEIVPTLVYAVFGCMTARGIKTDITNLEIVVKSVQDLKMAKLVKYKKYSKETTDRLEEVTENREVTSWQQVAYKLDDLTEANITDLQRLFKYLAEMHCRSM